MPIYNLIEYSNNYLKSSRSLWQCYRDEPSLNHDKDVIVDFSGTNHNRKSFKLKQKIPGDNGIKNVEAMVQIKHLIKFWRTLEMPLINCEINLILAWFKIFFIASNTADNQKTTFAITDAKRKCETITVIRITF